MLFECQILINGHSQKLCAGCSGYLLSMHGEVLEWWYIAIVDVAEVYNNRFLQLAIMLCSSHQRVTSSMVFCRSDLLFAMEFGLKVRSSEYFTAVDVNGRRESIYTSQNRGPIRVQRYWSKIRGTSYTLCFL